MMTIHFLTPRETRAEIAARLFGPGLMANVGALAEHDPAFGRVAEKAVSGGVKRYQWLTRWGIHYRADSGNWATTAEQFAERKRQRAARNRVRRIARRHGVHGAALLYTLHLERPEP